MKRLNAFLYGLLLVSGLHVVHAAQNKLKPKLAISPPRLEIYPEQEKNGYSITVLNLASTPMTVEVTTQNWDLDENNVFIPLPPNEQSLDQWLIINPVRLMIPPNSQQTVRLAVRPRAKPEQGEHRAMVFFRQMPEAGKRGQVNFNVGVPIYAYFGEVKREAKVHSLTFLPEKQELNIDISNLGNAYIRPEGVFVVMKKNALKKHEDILAYLDFNNDKITAEGVVASGKVLPQPVFAPQRRILKNQIPFDKIDEPYVLGIKMNIGEQVYEETFVVE